MKRIKGVFIIIVSLLILFFTELPVLAVENFQTELVANKIEIKKGEQIEVTLNFKNFQEINKGINAYKATLEYDTDLFEEVKTTDFNTLNYWEEFLYNSNNHEFIAIKKAGAKLDEAVISLVLTAKENINPKETNIKVKDIIASEGKKDIYVNDSQVIIQVIKEQNPNNPDNSTNIPDTELDNNDNNFNDSVLDEKLPQTGLNPIHSFILIIIEILIIIAIISFIKMKKIDKKINKKGKILFIILFAGIITIQLIGTIYAVVEKGELNNDGEINYKDVSLLEQHLIKLSALPDDKLENADMNSDGKLTVTDLSLLVQKIENTLDYKVDITSNMDNYYPEKNEEMELKFSASVSYGAKIDEVTINGQTYQVENEEDTTNYIVRIKTQNVSGIQEFKFTKVKLNVGKEIKVNYLIKVDVLKEEPVIQNYQITEIVEEAKLKVSFDIKDDDNSLLDAKIQLFEENVETKLVKEETVNSGNNEFILDLEENKDYLLNIYLSYNLDTDQLTEHEQDNTGAILETKELKLNIDYKFEFSNIKLYNEEGQEVDKYSKNEPIILSFTSTNATKFLPEYVVINEQKYEVMSNENNTYKVKIDGIKQTGEYELKVEEVILENGKAFTIENNNAVNVKIQKEKPELQNVNIEEQEDGIKVVFDIKDTDNAILKKKLIIKNASETNIFEKEIQDNLFNEICKIPNDLTTKYIIEVIVDYDITTDSSALQTNQVLYSQEITAKERAIIGNVTLSKTELEKNENVTINYEITTNKTNNIEKLIVNNIEAIATKGANNIYSVTIPVGNIAGIQEIKLSKIIFDDKAAISTSNIQEIEILKSVPTVENYQGEDDYDNLKVNLQFELEDIDSSFISGYVQLVTLDNQVKEKQEITSTGIQHFSLPVQEREEYNFQVVVTYARNEDKTEIITDKVLLEKPIQMIADYELKITNMQTKNQNTETKYFNRDENIKLLFTSTNVTKFIPEKVQINGTKYTLASLGNNQYEVILSAIPNVGLAEIKIEKIWMNNAKELEVQENNVAKIEILKLVPTVEKFEYEETQDGKVIARFEIVDNESAMTNAKAVVTDVTGTIYEQNDLKKGQNEITFNLTASEEYIVKIFADYDLDGNYLEIGANEHQNIEIDKEEMQILTELIELKDIISVSLYSKTGETIEEVTQLNVKNFDASKYLAKVTMKELPVFYAEIEEGIVEEGEFKLVLKYDNVVQYDETAKLNKLKVKFGEVDNDIVNNLKFEDIIEIIQNDETANISLTDDLDASNITVSTSTYFQNFKGTFNGNGHTIKNLSKPLFDKLENAKVSGLIIENAKVSEHSGILANKAVGAQINNVHIKDSTMHAGHWNGVGGFVGKAENKTIIENCSAYNIKVSGAKRIGGFAGYLNTNSEINNCYIEGTIVSTYDDAVGGLVGESEGAIKIQNTYSNVKMQNVKSTANAGIIGYAGGKNVTLINNISLADGNIGNRIIGANSGYTNSSKNNYEIKESKLASNSDNDKVKVISKDDINEEFFKETLNWNEEVWRLENVSANKLPTLKNLDPNKDLYIPDIARLRKMPNYDTNKEIAYHNMNLLIPFYDARLCVEYGNKIDVNNILNKQKIKMIIPYDSNNKMIVGINTNNYNKIAKIKIIFENEQTQDYTVEFKKKLSDIATYTIKELNVGYTYNKFILDTNIETVNEIVSKAKALDYKTEIQTVTPEDESRLYVDYYNQSVKNNIEQVILAIMSNQDTYNLYLDNEILKQKVEQDITENSMLEKILYTYNYFDKWYHIEMGEIPLSQIIFLNPDMLNKDIEIKDLVDTTISQGESIRKTANTVEYYNNVIKPKFGNKGIGEFLEYFMKILEGYDNGNDWFTNNFKGMMTERPITGKEDTVRYRAWEMLKMRTHILLPILTAPQEDMYIISVPSQFIFGSLNRYQDHINGNDTRMREDLDQYADYIQNFYEISSTFIKDSEKLLNSRVHIQYDSRFNFANSGTQEAGITEDSVIKWVYEAVGAMAPANGSGAFANGTDVYWVAYAALSRGSYSFTVFSHETAHNQDGYYFYEEMYRRNNTWAEDHADENIAQDLGDGSLVFNIREDFSVTEDTSSNLKLETITGTDNIYKYYKEMFETYYVLDYLTGQAFLKLTPEEQAKVAVKVTYDNGADYEVGGSKTTYVQLTADDFRNMNLQTMEDLWDNAIALRGTGSVGDGGAYGGDTHYSIYWYQPHNNNGRPDSYSFKRLGFEMLGVAGYSDGYVTYRSRKSENDLDALRQITGNDNITWRQYKMDRYKTVEQNLDNIPYFNAQEVIEVYKQALQKDAQNGNRNNTNAVRRTLYGTVKRATKDFSTGSIYNSGTEIEISSAEQLVNVLKTAEWGNYKLVNDIDFSNISTTENAYISKVFVGRLNGNGHKIEGLKATLFSSMTYAEIQDLTIEAPIYSSATTAILANTSKNSILNNVIVNDSNINLPYAKTISGTLQILGNSKINVHDAEIETVEDLLEISNSENSLSKKMSYVLKNDLDVSSVTGVEAIITGTFEGSINGNGHTISNLKVPLISILTGSVSNLNIENVEIRKSGTNNIAPLAGETQGATISDIKLDNVTIEGRDNTSALVGKASRNTKFNRISATNIYVKASHYYAGGIIGRSYDSKLKDILVSGTLEVVDTHNGGVIGALNRDTLENIYADVDVMRVREGDSRNKNAGLYGAIEAGAISIENVVVVGDMSDTLYKITPAETEAEINSIESYFTNVYEYEESTGISNSEVTEAIKKATSENLKDINFYVNTMGWSTTIWDFSEVASSGIPKIK